MALCQIKAGEEAFKGPYTYVLHLKYTTHSHLKTFFFIKNTIKNALRSNRNCTLNFLNPEHQCMKIVS